MWVYTALFSEIFMMRNNPGSCKRSQLPLEVRQTASGNALLLPPLSTLQRKLEVRSGGPQLQSQLGDQAYWISLDMHMESCSKLSFCFRKKGLFFGCFQVKMSINTTVTSKGFPEKWQRWEYLQHRNWQMLPGSPLPPQPQPISNICQYTIT